MQSARELLPNHQKLLRLTKIIRTFAYVTLIFYTLWTLFGILQVTSNQAFQSAWIRIDLLGILDGIVYILGIFVRGMIFWMLLLGVAAALQVAVSTDLNYKKNGQTLADQEGERMEFHSRQEVLELASWMRKTATIVIVAIIIVGVPDFMQMHETLISYNFRIGIFGVWLMTIIIGGLTTALEAALWFFAMRFMAAILKILLEIGGHLHTNLDSLSRE